MPIYITQGRYTREAIKGMIVKPEDRADAVARILSKIGGRLLGYYLTFGEYDFLAIAEAPNDVQMAAVLLAAGSGGGVLDGSVSAKSGSPRASRRRGTSPGSRRSPRRGTPRTAPADRRRTPTPPPR